MSKKQSFQISLKLIQTQFNKGLNNVKKQLRSFGSFVKSAFALGTVTAFGRKMIQVGADFENAMARVKAVTNATRREFSMMQKEAQRLGETTKYTATEAANALETLTRNGMSATQATKALSGVLELAQANSIELANAADIITNSLNMFGMQVSETSRVNDVLSATAANSATDINLLYEALVNAAPAAHVLGFSIEETSAALAALANQGVKGANAGTAIRTALTKMADPKIIKRMKEMGVAIDEQTMKEEGLLGTVKRLKDAQLSLSDLVAIFSQRGAVGIQQLISSYHDFELMLEITKNSAGTTARMFQQGVGSVQKEVDTLKSKYEGLLISISQKTGGVVRGAIKALQTLIDNFKSIGGTIANLASVVVPLLAKNLNNLIKTTRAGLAAIKTEAAAVKVALGNWIGVIATIVTWIGTYLFSAWNKVYGEVKRANKEFANSSSEFTRMKTYANNLIDKLGPDTDKTTLAGVVNQLTELFPDFKDEIHNAAAEALKASTGSGGMAKLKETLAEIIALQSTMMEQQGKQKLFDANAVALGNEIFKGTGSPNPIEYAVEKSIRKQLGTGASKAIYGSAQSQREFFQNLGQFIARPDFEEAFQMTSSVLKGAGVSIDDESLRKMVEYWRGSQRGQTTVGLGNDISNAQDILDKHRQELLEAQEAATAAAAAAEEEAARLEEENNKKKSRQKTVEDIEKKLGNTIADVQDDLKLGVIDNEKALQELTAAYKAAYEEWRSLQRENPNLAGKKNPYQDRYVNLANGISKVDSSKVLKGKAETRPETLPRPTNVPSSNIDVNIPYDLSDLITDLEGATDLLGNMNNVVQNISSAFNTLNDEEASFLEKLSASVQLMQAIPTILKTINTLTEMGTALKTAQNVVDAKGATVKTAGAIASIFGANAEIPIAGIAIAAAGVAALIAALASAPKFAQGGVVGGNSFYGDKNFARVNSGEMILNGTQQAKLFDMINNGTSNRTQDVQFVIRGKDLYGALKNYNDSTSKIRSNL